MDPLRRLTAGQKYALACKLRRTAPPAERHAWTLVRNRGVLGLKFRRQHVLRGFIVDFYCAAERLVLELEGHVQGRSEREIYDIARAQILEAAGYQVIRIKNCDLTREHLEATLQDALGKRLLVPPLPQGEGDRG